MDWQRQWQIFWNQLAFSRRTLLRWQRGFYQEPPESKADLWKGKPNPEDWQRREIRLLQQYNLASLKASSSRFRYLETLTFLEYLEQLLGHRTLPKTPRWLDVGAKNWSYVEALYRILETRTQDFALDGIELDGYRVYADLHSRIDYAKSFIKDLPKAHYQVGDVLKHQAHYDVISCFLPFVFEEPCLAWGLPSRHFQPQALLEHLVSLLEPEGYLIITNQGKDEAQEQERLFQQIDPHGNRLQVWPIGELPASFWPYEIPRYGWLAQKPSSLK